MWFCWLLCVMYWWIARFRAFLCDFDSSRIVIVWRIGLIFLCCCILFILIFCVCFDCLLILMVVFWLMCWWVLGLGCILIRVDIVVIRRRRSRVFRFFRVFVVVYCLFLFLCLLLFLLFLRIFCFFVVLLLVLMFLGMWFTFRFVLSRFARRFARRNCRIGICVLFCVCYCWVLWWRIWWNFCLLFFCVCLCCWCIWWGIYLVVMVWCCMCVFCKYCWFFVLLMLWVCEMCCGCVCLSLCVLMCVVGWCEIWWMKDDVLKWCYWSARATTWGFRAGETRDDLIFFWFFGWFWILLNDWDDCLLGGSYCSVFYVWMMKLVCFFVAFVRAFINFFCFDAGVGFFCINYVWMCSYVSVLCVWMCVSGYFVFFLLLFCYYLLCCWFVRGRRRGDGSDAFVRAFCFNFRSVSFFFF